MLLMPVTQAVMDAAQEESSVLTLTFHSAEFDAALWFVKGRIMAMRGAALPLMSSALQAYGLQPASIAQARQRSANVSELMETLVARGLISDEDVTVLMRERVVSGLLPLVWRPALARISPAPPLGGVGAGAEFGGANRGTEAGDALQEAERHADALTRRERALQFSDRFVASPLAGRVAPEGDPLDLVYRAALRGLTLGEMARRLPQRWDSLARNVLSLQDAGVLHNEREAPRRKVGRKVAPQIAVGDPAPDFCLPDYNGGELRLSDLRGKPVWLIFNRQSTCALCNPHHAQIIAMSDRMRQQGVQIVSVWGSSLTDLQHGIGELRPPYPVLADPRDEIYDRYGLTRSWGGVLDARNVPTALKGLRMLGVKALKDDGELTRMPAEFLINPDGRVALVHYNTYGTEWLPMERVFAWAGDHAAALSPLGAEGWEEF